MAKQQVKSLSELDGELAGLHMKGQWQFDAATADLTDGPRPAGAPHLWQWSTVRAKLLDACEAMPQSFTARRALTFANPGLPKPGTTHTIIAAIQMVLPHEVAWAHRHTMGAIRFAIEGDPALYTAVDGARFPMEPGDLVLTPNWTWHDHHNESERPGIWLDVLDVPLAFTLNQVFYEPFGESVQPVDPERRLPYRYPWRQVRDQLFAAAKSDELDPFEGAMLRYAGPGNGATLPTLGCSIQLLPVGFETRRHRQSSSAVYHVVSGSGSTLAGSETIAWSEHDTFAIPNWMAHQHRNEGSEEAILFAVSDEPVLAALGLFREDQPRPRTPRTIAPL